MNANIKNPATPDLHLSFDVGHSSIGWAVLQSGASVPLAQDVNILGCGAVIFRADDCLASSRRAYRRQRRHIRATRQRIARIKVLLSQLGVMTIDELNKPGCAWPWQLAAQVLCGGANLTWPELWDVFRWYAHNRGYDANRRWSAAEAEAQAEDTEKEENARNLMQKHGVKSMAETFCKELGVDPLGKKRSSTVRFKGLNAAFPRSVVEGEVRRILQAHVKKLRGVDADLEKALFTDWRAIPCEGLKLPKRYQGGLLFGQLVPRFDNRIIAECQISRQKVPSRNCPEFLNFRWAMQVANIRVAKPADRELRALTVEERKTLDQTMRAEGSLTATELKKLVRETTGCTRDNLDTMLMHPDAKEALLLDPAQELIKSGHLKTLWPLLPERIQKRARGQWRRGKTLTLGQLRDQAAAVGASVAALDAELARIVDTAATKARKKDKKLTPESILGDPLRIKRLDGRAAYARPLLKKAYEEVMAGKHPKEGGGCLFVTEEMRQAQLQREIADQTNNHLVRHRLLILERLLKDVIKEYGAGQPTRIAGITIEVNRDLREMSGKTAKEKAQDLGLRIANHHAVAAKLEKDLKDERLNGKPIRISPGLIRKGRIAEDLGWMCPYTGKAYEPMDLVTRQVDKDHIVPRSDRLSDSLDSLVVTFSPVNKWKGKRTAFQFVEEEQGKTVPDLPKLSILSLSRYRELVEGLETYRGHDDDKRRKKRRKELLLLPRYEEKEFTPRDLTVTSQLVRLGAQVLKRPFMGLDRQPPVVSLPGSVTGTVRKGWNLLGCLSLACSQVLDEEGQVKTKTDIRDITHLHHALDACVLGLASHFIPNNGSVWELIIKRNLNDMERLQLRALGIFEFDAQGRSLLRDLPNELKEQIRQRLAEKRVVQHIPARMDGLRVEQNTWRVVKIEDGEATIRQRIRQPDGKRPVKETDEKVTKLLGLEEGKLQANKGVLVIPDNFGVALDPEPTIIPFHKVWTRLQEIKTANNGRRPRLLRNGQIIQVPKGRYQGTWRVFSSKATMTLDLGSPDKVRLESRGEGQKREVQIKTLLKDGMTILRTPLTGVASCPTTLSA